MASSEYVLVADQDTSAKVVIILIQANLPAPVAWNGNLTTDNLVVSEWSTTATWCVHDSLSAQRAYKNKIYSLNIILFT